MHCHICDADSDTVVNEGGSSFTPCGDCQAAIFECLMGYPDIPVLDETIELIEGDFDEYSVTTRTDYFSGLGRSYDPRSLLLDAGTNQADL